MNTKELVSGIDNYLTNDKDSKRLDLLTFPAKIKKNEKDLLIMLIDDYSKDKTKLKPIKDFLKSFNNNLIHPETTRNSKKDKVTENPLKPMHHPFPISTRISNNLADENMGKESQDSTEKAFIIGILGDWEIPGTKGYEIINGTNPIIRVNGGPKHHVGAFDMSKILLWLQKHSNNAIKRQFTVTNTVEEGGNHPGWVLTEVNSGASYNSRQITYIKDGVPTVRDWKGF